MQRNIGFACLSVPGTCLAVLGAACASPSFVVDGDEGGADVITTHDAASGEDVKTSRVDGGGDAHGHKGDASLPPADVATRSDVQPTEASPPTDVGAPDVAHPVDSGGDSGGDGATGPACATKQTSDDIGVFVTLGGGDDSGQCTRNAPCSSVAVAMGVASAGGYSTVYVAPGTYAATGPTAIKDGITVQGGWTVNGTTWTGSCNPADTPTLTAPATVVTVGSPTSPSAGAVRLDTLVIENTASAATGSAESFYGVFAVGTAGVSSLRLMNVQITAPPGGSGPNGNSGTTGATGTSGGCSETSGGNVGTVGNPGGEGTYTISGYTPQSANGSTAGTGGTGATPAGVTNCTTIAPYSCCGTSESGQTLCTMPTPSGCGGFGGTGGITGGGGGASIGLYLWNEAATVRAGAIASGLGGTGGTGGQGGQGGAGASGGPVAAPAKAQSSCTEISIPGGGTTCQHKDTTIDGLPGAQGGQGGTGGQGGGGAGGDSYSVYSNNPMTVTVENSPSFTYSAGAAGSPNGSSGQAGALNP